MEDKKSKKTEMLSMSEKNRNKKAWYKEKADSLETFYNNFHYLNGEVSEFKRIKRNYDLYNNILNLEDLNYVCKPLGDKVGELPARMVNRDISSTKIKVILGMEMKRPFSFNVVAVNPEATTKREQEEFGMIKQYVINQIMLPIQEQIEKEKFEQLEGREPSPEEMQEIQGQIQQELQAMTPEEVKRYMEREYQDPAEILSHQLLEYLIQKLDIEHKFNNMMKDACLSAKELGYVGIMNDEPFFHVCNPLRFSCDVHGDNIFIEDGEWATYEFRMTPSEVVKYFGKELKNSEIEKLYEDFSFYKQDINKGRLFESTSLFLPEDADTIRVLHCVWKSLREIKFLNYMDENLGEVQTRIVDESYKLDIEAGDISIESEWIPEVYETWKIGADIYVRMQPIPGQFKDLDTIYECKLPYYGAIHDATNSTPTSIMDRLVPYQYYYNIIMYKLELLISTDKGKKLLVNLNSIPDTEGINIKNWQYFFESSPFLYVDPNQEGVNYNDMNMAAKVIDMSLASSIDQYINIAEYLRKQSGQSVGITEHVEGQVGPHEAVGNTQQNLMQSSHILEPYFELHNTVKKNILTAIIEAAKVAYSGSQPRKLTYILDDLTKQVINLEPAILDNSTLGIFVNNSMKTEEIKELLKQLTHAALQNQTVELSDVISVLKQNSIAEAEETLKVAEKNRREHEQNMQMQQSQSQQELIEMQRESDREKHEQEKEKIILKEEERRKTEIAKAAIMGASFNPEQDADRDGINDFIEIADKATELDLKVAKSKREDEKLQHQKSVDKEKIEIERKKLAKQQKS